ncbi:hypothetical protein OIU85_029230 [Salix viminalis]|uniref:Uncharacterized protein n=1 Tax=Salix viminalis TaxID=40686 RepID=A0A9Q0QAX6_SALVM|nr:hypothetical protein OIU85_029230 [Salix viminalis]
MSLNRESPATDEKACKTKVKFQEIRWRRRHYSGGPGGDGTNVKNVQPTKEMGSSYCLWSTYSCVKIIGSCDLSEQRKRWLNWPGKSFAKVEYVFPLDLSSSSSVESYQPSQESDMAPRTRRPGNARCTIIYMTEVNGSVHALPVAEIASDGFPTALKPIEIWRAA